MLANSKVNSKTIFKQVDFWLQILHIFITTLALIFIPDYGSVFGYTILKIHTIAFGVFGLAFLQILSAILNFFIYKNERSKYRKFYEKFTLAFILVLILFFYYYDLTQESKSFVHIGALMVQISLLIFSPFLAVYYLAIIFLEYRILGFKNWWQVPLVLSIFILTFLGIWQINTPQKF